MLAATDQYAAVLLAGGIHVLKMDDGTTVKTQPEGFVHAACMDASDDVCVTEQDNGATCVDGFDCKSRNCVADGTTGARTCQALTAPQCFYGGGCAAGGGRPSFAALLLMGLFVVVALLRTRRRAR